MKGATPESRERALYEEFEAAKRTAEASSVFARIDGSEAGRFPLTGRGDVNTYALFAELFAQLASKRGRAGVIVPTGIATDATTAPFFAALVAGNRLAWLIDFENRERIFPAIDSRMKFSLLTIGWDVKESGFAFFLTNTHQLAEPQRRFTLSADDIARINPNTKTAPVFRSRTDAELTAKIYGRVPVLVRDNGAEASNPWGVRVHTRIWHMAEDSAWFRSTGQLENQGYVRNGMNWSMPQGISAIQRTLPLVGGQDRTTLALDSAPGAGNETYVPLYEAKMVHQFDHRWATYSRDGSTGRDVTPLEKADATFEPSPRYWVPSDEVEARLTAKGWSHRWLIGWRDITNATNERTVISTAFPRVASGHKVPLMFPDLGVATRLVAGLIGNLSSLSLDYVARQKIGGTSLTYFYLKQLPVLSPSFYNGAALDFIVPRVVELTYTSHSMTPFARDLGYEGSPFGWDESRRAHLRAELDAWYARAYGLSRDELRYILDPADVRGADFPSETFRGLKKNEIARFGEFRTARLVLQAWDRLEQGDLE